MNLSNFSRGFKYCNCFSSSIIHISIELGDKFHEELLQVFVGGNADLKKTARNYKKGIPLPVGGGGQVKGYMHNSHLHT